MSEPSYRLNTCRFVAALIAVFNIIMQLAPRVADRPVRLNIAPGDSKPIDVKKLD